VGAHAPALPRNTPRSPPLASLLFAAGSTAPMWAVEKCKTTTVEALCAHSQAETFETRNRSGKTMLIMAVEKGRLDTIKYMVRAGARASTKDSTGRSAASVARDMGLKGATIDLLLEAEAREIEADAAKAAKAAEKAAEKRTAAGAGAGADSSAASGTLARGRSSSQLAQAQPQTPQAREREQLAPSSMNAKFASSSTGSVRVGGSPASSNRSSVSYADGAGAMGRSASSERLNVIGRGARR
jgi:hypothetical protein